MCPANRPWSLGLNNSSLNVQSNHFSEVGSLAKMDGIESTPLHINTLVLEDTPSSGFADPSRSLASFQGLRSLLLSVLCWLPAALCVLVLFTLVKLAPTLLFQMGVAMAPACRLGSILPIDPLPVLSLLKRGLVKVSVSALLQIMILTR